MGAFAIEVLTKELGDSTLSDEYRENLKFELALETVQVTPGFFSAFENLNKRFVSPNLTTVNDVLLSFLFNKEGINEEDNYGKYKGKSLKHMESLREFANPDMILALSILGKKINSVSELEKLASLPAFKRKGEHMTGPLVEADEPNEIPQNPVFIEVPLNGKGFGRCVDGRPPEVIEGYTGPQMPGGDLFPVFLSAVATGRNFDATVVKEGFQTLKDAGYALGVHRGHHHEGAKSDCGFSDRLVDIFTTAVREEAEIKRRFKAIQEENKDFFKNIDLDLSIDTAYNMLRAYKPEQIVLTGEALIQTAVDEGATAAMVLHDHGEKVAWVNTKPDVTLDTVAINTQHEPQGFNIDINAAVERANVVGVEPNVAFGASLIMYMATEMVLVEQKGKPGLPVAIIR